MNERTLRMRLERDGLDRDEIEARVDEWAEDRMQWQRDSELQEQETAVYMAEQQPARRAA